ncbi:MAG: hypothetical protein HY039_00985 [Nitrospirae bacterium]|nr:hypothetical protein [Nitrospirota bacterium]
MSAAAGKKSLAVTLLGIAVLGLGVIGLFDPPALQSVGRIAKALSFAPSEPEPLAFRCPPAYGTGAAVLFFTMGIGLLARRRWAWRAGRIVLPASLVSWPLGIAVLFGWQAVLAFPTLLGLIPVGVAAAFLFSRPWVREEFAVGKAGFSRLSRVLLAGLAGAVLLPLVFVVGVRIAAGAFQPHPFFVPPVREVVLSAEGEIAGYRRVDLPGFSFRLPWDFSVVDGVYRAPDEGWSVYLSHPEGRDKGWLMVSPWGDVGSLLRDGFGRFGYKSGHDIERAIHENRWSPLFAALRGALYPSEVIFPVESFDGERTRGFVTTAHYADQGRFSYWAAIYPKDGRSSVRNLTISSKERVSGKEVVYRVLSSVEFRGPSKGDAPRLHEEGRAALERGDIAEAQFKLMGAYLADPHTPEHGFLLAKAAARTGERGARLARRLANETLKAVPDHKGARELLKGLGPEDGEKP